MLYFFYLQKWPPPKIVDYKPVDAKLQPSGVNVLEKWQQSSEKAPISSGTVLSIFFVLYENINKLEARQVNQNSLN